MDKTTIRSATPDDAVTLLEIYGWYVRHSAVTFEYDVPSESEFRRRIGATLEKYPYFVVEDDGVVLGYAYAGAFRSRPAYGWSAELSIYLAPAARRKGLGRKLYRAMEDALGRMGILNLYACITWPETEDEYLDKSSPAFHESMGYTTVGVFRRCGYKFGRWYSMIWMEKIIGGHDCPPMDVTPYPQLPDKPI